MNNENNNGYNNNYNDMNNYNNNYNNYNNMNNYANNYNAYNNMNNYNNSYNNYNDMNNMNNYNDMNNMNNYNNYQPTNNPYQQPNIFYQTPMDTSQKEETLSYHLKRFLIGFLLVALFIFVLLWLFPTKQALKSALFDAVNPLTDRIFSENMNTLKETAIAYYTTDRLPTNTGETKKLTLGEMLEKKLLLTLKDKNGNMCNSEKSYIEITKMDNEYKLKVNLSCGDEEDYILTYLGCYNYCINDICENKKTTTAKNQNNQTIFQKITKGFKNIIPTSTSTTTKTKTKPKYYCAVVSGKYYDNKGNKVSRDKYRKACYKEPKYYCAIVNGKYYDNKGNKVTKTAYKKACYKEPKYYCAIVNGNYYDNKGNKVTKQKYQEACNSTPPKYYCAVVNGKYYDSNGNKVSKEEYKNSCYPEPKYYCAVVNGKYYDSNGNKVSKEEYKNSCYPEPKYYCAVVNGKYYDNNGNKVSKEEYQKACNKEPIKYKYLYQKEETKHYEKEYSNWTDWSDKIQYTSSDNINWGKHELVWNEKVGYKLTTTYKTAKEKPIWKKTTQKTGSYTKYGCAEYNYFYNETTKTTYTTTTGSAFTGTKVIVTSTIPSDTNTTHYQFAGMSYKDCGTVCDITPQYKFIVQTRSASKTTAVSSSSTSSNLKVTCKKTVKKQIPIYSQVNTIVGYGVDKIQTKTYYYHKKTRKITKEEQTKIEKLEKWSYSKHDEALIKQGYEYTGIYKQVEYN